ncbi:MAG TPA: glutathione S-transferase family protein [Beijerinckiaceae bacterium]|nr:glutathione S-transferase family protein [Beijerinckiaceae bacterium]
MSLTLVIGNKAYSSWSLRPWLALKQMGIAFDEVLIPLDQPETKAAIARHSPAGRVPVLIDGDLAVWESLAILEYVNETHANGRLWPQDRVARAHARVIANEMHAGFSALRNALPMNVRRPIGALPMSVAVLADIARIETLWRDARQRYGQDGPFLFGAFSAADAMYAPVVFRFHHYAVPVAEDTRAYMDRMRALPALREWVVAGTIEPWIIADDEK